MEYYKLTSHKNADAITRLMYNAIRHKETLFYEWERSSIYFPQFKQSNEAYALYDEVEAITGSYGKRSGIQFIFHLPDSDDTNREKFGLHVDGMLPGDATKPYYTKIVAVALTPWTKENGTLWINEYEYITLEKYGIMAMDGQTPHGLGTNKTSHPRIGVYFRWYE